MSGRVLKGLSGLVIVLIGVWAYVLHRQVTPRSMPFEVAVTPAQSITLQQQGRSIVFQRAGERWTVGVGGKSRFYRVDDQRMVGLLDGLRSLQLEDVISDRADRAADFEVDASSGVRVTLRDATQKVIADGIIGKQGQRSSQMYFRYPQQNQVWLTRGMYRSDLGGLDFPMWRDPQLLPLLESDIQAVEIQGKGFRTELVLSSTTWLVGGKLADTNQVNGLLGALRHLQATAFIDSPSALETSGSYVTVRSSATTLTLRIGSVDAPNKRVVVGLPADEGAAWVEEARIQALMRKSSDFQVK